MSQINVDKSADGGQDATPAVPERRKVVGIVEDDDSLVRILCRHLDREGYKTMVFQSPDTTIDSVLRRELDVLLVDLTLPTCDGAELARNVRDVSPIPMVIITGRGEIEARVSSLDAGADDYLIKPFDPRELSARLRAIFRRVEANPGPDQHTCAWRFSNSHMLPYSRQLLGYNGKSVKFTEVEYLVLEFLLQRLGMPVSRDELSFRTTGRRWNPPDRRIDVHVTRIRRKLTSLGEKRLAIRCVRGVGYMAEGIASLFPTETLAQTKAGVLQKPATRPRR